MVFNTIWRSLLFPQLFLPTLHPIHIYVPLFRITSALGALTPKYVRCTVFSVLTVAVAMFNLLCLSGLRKINYILFYYILLYSILPFAGTLVHSLLIVYRSHSLLYTYTCTVTTVHIIAYQRRHTHCKNSKAFDT
jgi:hypothetical protein